MTPDDAQLFERAVRDHGALVARIVSAYEARPDLAAELVQDVFTALWGALPGFRHEASLRTLLARIAQNIAVSHVRRAVRTRTEPLTPELPAAEPNVDRAQLLAAVRALPLPLRQAVTLHLEGFKDRESAALLGISEGAVAVRLTRARAALRIAMGAHR